MEQGLIDVFAQARKLVVETDRRLAEERDRILAKEREVKLLELSSLIESAFDFTSKEKLELDPRLDIQDGQLTVEFIVRSERAIFLLTPLPEGLWSLFALEDGREPNPLGEFQGGKKGDGSSRRLSAARVVAAIGDWAQRGNLGLAAKKTVQVESNGRWQDAPIQFELPEKREPTYGTMGKFLGY